MPLSPALICYRLAPIEECCCGGSKPASPAVLAVLRNVDVIIGPSLLKVIIKRCTFSQITCF